MTFPDLATVTEVLRQEIPDPSVLRLYLCQIGRAALGDGDNGDTTASQARTVWTSLAITDQQEDLSSLLVDVLWLVTMSSSVSSDSALPQLLVRDTVQAYPWTRTALVQTLDARLLQDATLIPNQADFQKKLRQYNTATFYRQNKWNLLHEESEGYSKLLQFLLSVSNEHLHFASSTNIPSSSDNISRLETLIGTFSLDPNRVLDLLLNVLELAFANPKEAPGSPGTETSTSSASRMVALLVALPSDNLPKLLAFEFQGRPLQQQTPLLKVMAFLAAHNALDVEKMLSFLPSSWMDAANDLEVAWRKQETSRVRDLGKVRLSSPAPVANGTHEPGSEQQSAVQQLHTTLVSSPAIQFLQTLFVTQPLRAWPLARKVGVVNWSQLCTLLPDTIGVALIDWTHQEIQPLLQRRVAPVPWTESCREQKGDTASDDAMDINNGDKRKDRDTLSFLLHIVVEPLSYVKNSGCIVLRPVFFSQLCRLLAAYNNDTTEEEVSEKVLAFYKSFLLPTLSLFPSSPSRSAEVWTVMQPLSYRTRYALYKSWRGTGLERAGLHDSAKPLWQVSGEIQAGKDARYQLKRLSKDTIRDVSRGVAKVCHHHPLVVFSTILSQIESYDNLVEVMVDALRFVTPLSLDVLGFCILSRLSGSGDNGFVNRSRLKEDGVNVSQWLQSLESFTGYFYKRFPSMELRGILRYLIGRLKDGHVMELGMLRTLLKTAGGWAFADYSPAANLSMTQLEGRAGSTALQRETMSFGVIERFNLSASNAVRRVLQTDGAGVSLLILLAQVRHQIIFEGSSTDPPKPVKLIGNLVDTCQSVMTVLLNFLIADPAGMNGQTASSIVKIATFMPSLEKLCTDYGMDVAFAWMLCRPFIRKAAINKDLPNALSAFRISSELQMIYKASLPSITWDYISTTLFEIFYTKSLYDLFCPEEVYASEIARLEKEGERFAIQKDASPSTSVQPGNAPVASIQDEINRCETTVVKLKADLAKQKRHVAESRKTIQELAADLFESKTANEESATAFLTRCVFPRCMQGPDDALYCAHFVKFLHEIETPGFGTLYIFDVTVVSLSRALFGMTEGEAANVSILLCEIWKVASKWRYEKDSFDTEITGKPCSMLLNKKRGSIQPVSYAEFEVLYNRWHAAIGAAAIGCLQSSEYIHTRNCLIVLKRMVEVYPTRPRLGNELLEALVPLQDEGNKFADIRASAQAFSTQLLRARDDGVWKEEDPAIVKARRATEQAAAVARQKKAEEQMAELKRDSEKITEEIGEWDNNHRGDRRRPLPAVGTRDSRAPLPREVEDGRRARGQENGDRSRSQEARHTPTDASRGRLEDPGGSSRREPQRDDRWSRGARQGDNFSTLATSGRREDPSREEAPRGFEGRFQRPRQDPPQPIPPRTATKRSRPSSPSEPGESSEPLLQRSKRPRIDDIDKDDGRHPVRRRGGRR